MFRYISKKLKFFIGGSNHKKSTLNHEASCKCECHNVDLEETKNEKIILELYKGVTKNMIIEREFNEIYFSWNILWQFFIHFLFNFFIRKFGNFLYLFSLIMSSAFIEFNSVLYQIGLFLAYFCYFIIYDIIFLLKKIRTWGRFKNKKIKVFNFNKASNSLQSKEWKLLKKGDIILFKNEEYAPADIAFLDSNESYCFADTKLINGKDELALKIPLKSTKTEKGSFLKGNIDDYKNILTGKLEYGYFLDSKSKETSYKGKIKLQKEPKIEEFDLKNVILQGSKIRCIDWGFGIILNVGMKSKIMNYFNFSPFYKNSYLDWKMNIFVIITSLLIIILSIISSLFFTYISKDEISIKFTRYPFAEFLIRFTQYFPLGLYFSISLTETIYTYIIEKFYAKKPIPFYLLDPSKIHKPQKEHKRLKINNPSVLSKLNKIQHAIINPDIFCEENPAELRGLLIDQIIYSTLRYSEENEAPLLISNRNSFNVDEIKPFFQSEIKRDIDKSPNNNNTLFLSDFSVNQSFNRIPYSFNEDDIGSFLIDEEASYRQMEIFKALALCHSTKSKATRDGNIEFCYLSQDEQRAIEYARLRDFSFEGVSYSKVNSDYRCYTLKIKDKKIHFPILSINRLEEKQSSFSIVVQDVESEEKDESNSSTFYIKSNDISILNKFDLEADQMIAINDLLKKAKFDGLRFIIYGRKKMDKFQTLEYIQKVNILKSRLANHNNENDIFFQKLESDLYLITIAFFHDKIKENSKVLIKNLKEAQIPIWILTNQSETNAIALAYKTKILEKEWEIYDFKIDSINSGLITLSDFLLKIRNKIVTKSINNKIPYLTILSKNFEAISGKNDQNNEQSDKWKAFILLINGESLVIIKKDFHLLEHFKFLLSFCKGFLAYDMSQSHRRIFLQILKEVNSGNIIMSVGSNYADFPLLYESNIGVLIKKENSIVETEERLLVDEGDLIVEDIEMLSDLIFARSRTIDEKLDVILNFIFFCSFLYSNHILMFLANSNFLTFFYYEPSEGILKDGFITICPLLLYLLNSEDKNALILQNIPIFYNEKNFISIKKLFRDFALKIVLRSLIESMLIYFMFTGNLIMDRGVLNSYKLCIVEVFYANGLFVYMHFFNKIEETNLIESHTFWLIQFAFYGYFLLAILQLMEENLFKETIVTKFLEALRFPEYGFISTFFVLSLFGMNHLYELYVFPYLDSTLYDKFLQKFKEGMKFKAIVKELTPKVLYQNALIEITEKAKNFFTKIRMDSILQELINPIEMSHDLSYNQVTLIFRENEIEKKYQHKLKMENIRAYKYANINSIILFVISASLLFPTADEFTTTMIAYFLIAYSFLLSIILLLTFMSNPFKLFDRYKRLTLIFMLIIIIMMAIFCRSELENSLFLLIVWEMLSSSSNSFYSFRSYIIGVGGNLLIIIIKLGIDTAFSNYYKCFYIFASMFYVFIQFNQRYIFEKTNRDVFLSEQNIKYEIKKIHDILSILVPSFIKDLFLRGVYTLSEEQPNVAILFLDIYEFDKIVSTESTNIVKILDNLYRGFDQICLDYSIQKIETVGKTYMACSGLNEGSFQKSDKSNRTMKVLEMALQINNYIKQVTWGSAGQKITLKMGIHYGKVIAGVIGDHKPQFSLIGDTVNTTSRVCSTSEKGIITLSEEAYNEVKDCLQLYQFKLREVEAKGKGTLNTYQVVKVPKNLRRNLENKNYQMKEVMMMANIKKKENEQNIMKVVEIGRFFNDEKLKDIDEKTILFQKKISLKDNHSLGSKDEYNNESIMKICPKIETIEEYKNKNLIGEDKERQDFRSFPSYSMNSFEHDDSKKGSIYLNHKKNFTRFKRNIAHELLEDLEDIQKIVINKSTSIKGIQNNINLEGISNRTEKKILEVPISNQQRDFKKEEVMHRNSEQTREVLALRNSFFLLFAPQCNHSLIREYEQNLLNLGNTANKVSFLMLSMTSIIQFFSIMVGDVENLSLAIYWLILYGKISHIIFPLILFKYYQAILVKYKNIATFSIIFFACFYVFNFFFENKRLSNILGLVFFLNVMLNINNLNFREIFLCLLIFCLVFIVLVCFLENLVTFSWMETIFLLSNCIFLLFKIRKKNIRFIEQFNALKVSLFHKNQQENLITYLLPPHILTALTQNNSLIVDILDDVTILFADIAGFTKYSSSVSALEVLSMLRELFTEFDRLCFNYKVYKVYTIGDCYVILGILDIKNRDPVMELFKVLMVAFDMLEIIKNVKRKINFNELNMRIGIHTGTIIGGVLGTDIVRYDIYGRDVMIANKMESNGIAGKINISEVTKKLIIKNFPQNFIFEDSNDVFIPSSNETIKGSFVYNYHEMF